MIMFFNFILSIVLNKSGLYLEGFQAECDEAYDPTKIYVCLSGYSSIYYVSLIGNIIFRVFFSIYQFLYLSGINRSIENVNYNISYEHINDLFTSIQYEQLPSSSFFIVLTFKIIDFI